jgi:hypothetical protein
VAGGAGGGVDKADIDETVVDGGAVAGRAGGGKTAEDDAGAGGGELTAGDRTAGNAVARDDGGATNGGETAGGDEEAAGGKMTVGGGAAKGDERAGGGKVASGEETAVGDEGAEAMGWVGANGAVAVEGGGVGMPGRGRVREALDRVGEVLRLSSRAGEFSKDDGKLPGRLLVLGESGGDALTRLLLFTRGEEGLDALTDSDVARELGGAGSCADLGSFDGRTADLRVRSDGCGGCVSLFLLMQKEKKGNGDDEDATSGTHSCCRGGKGVCRWAPGEDRLFARGLRIVVRR